jgi:hypothetical protein
MRLQGRRWLVEVAGVSSSEIDLEFTITRNLGRKPSTGEVKLYNLKEATRSRIEAARGARLVLRAGYEESGDPPPTLFSGDVRRVFSKVEGVDLVTTVQGRDGGEAYMLGRMSRSYAPGTPIRTVLRDAVDAMGIGRGNLDDFDPSLRNGQSDFPDGFAAHGPARTVIDAIVRGAGLRWSVQSGALQLIQRGRALQGRAVILSPDTGLIESPTRADTQGGNRTARGAVEATCLIQPGLDPGRQVRIESRLITGSYIVRTVEYKGSTFAQDWYAKLTLRPLNAA